MIACIDVDYDDSDPASTRARVACVVIEDWESGASEAEYTRELTDVAPYVPGQFFQRELPCVLAVLELVEQPLDCIVVDGYVTLDAAGTLGMGGYLYEFLDRRFPVIGVAKHPFRSNTAAIELLRGDSERPLFVTALGIEPERAADRIARMHGQFRLPTILKRVDRLCRDGE